jgi:very-short-patch-repair endonuclease
LVIEIDGRIHLKKEVAERDKGREYMLKNFDLHILRFNNDSIINDIENVLLQLRETISTLSAL